jgi:hypothetical protein
VGGTDRGGGIVDKSASNANVKIEVSLLQGEVAPGFEEVASEFEKNFAQRGEVGAACAVYQGGRKVVDLWGGYRDREALTPWEEDTLEPDAMGIGVPPPPVAYFGPLILGLLLNRKIPVPFLPLTMQHTAIEREEHNLEGKFGEEYVSYRARVYAAGFSRS